MNSKATLKVTGIFLKMTASLSFVEISPIINANSQQFKLASINALVRTKQHNIFTENYETER